MENLYKIVTGDATQPVGEGNKIIAHICNDIGAWGAGFVLALSKRWESPALQYKLGANSGEALLGEIQLVPVEFSPDIYVANMIAQRGVGFHKGKPPIRYDALRSCLSQLAVEALAYDASVHMPRIGCGLAGGKWETVESIVKSTLVAAGVSVTVYDFE